MYESVQQPLDASRGIEWALYKYWPQGLFARIFHQSLGIDNLNNYEIDGIF